MWNLIQLLNDYEKTLNKKQPFYWDEQNIYIDYHTCYICSKQYGFIKWLVENDKIDLDKVENKFYYDICLTDYWDTERAYWKSDLVISVLSISDNPIEDLCKLLK